MARRDSEDVFAALYLVVLRSETGGGKTELLAALAARGAQVLDLEDLAGHRGSAFGGLGRGPQPSHRRFQAAVAARARGLDRTRPVFIEQEGPYLGAVGVPPALVARMGTADGIRISRAREERVRRISAEYAAICTDELLAAVARLTRRLDPSRAQAARDCVIAGRVAGAVDVLLAYYDAAYEHQLSAAPPPRAAIDVTGRSIDGVAAEIEAFASSWFEATPCDRPRYTAR